MPKLVALLFLCTTLFAQQKGTFTDTRDGKVYKTVKIGEQVWMAENLNYNASGSKCQYNEPAYCKKYGRLYEWQTAMALPDSCKSEKCISQIGANHKGICPKGWHLPDTTEWEVLTEAVGSKDIAGKYLKATHGWFKNGNGEDKFGFSALPGGRVFWGGGFHDDGEGGYWWSTNEHYSSYSYMSGMVYHREYVFYDSFQKGSLFSIRCIQDPAPPKGESK